MLDIPDFESKYLDVLQNIEMAIVSVHKQHSDLIDANVETAIQALIQTYRGEALGKGEKIPGSPMALKVYTAVKGMCEWRLGREELRNEDQTPADIPMTPLKVEEIIACLQRIRRSIRMWNKQGGRQGYIYFISQFIP